jgi:hypothetical protein
MPNSSPRGRTFVRLLAVLAAMSAIVVVSAALAAPPGDRGGPPGQAKATVAKKPKPEKGNSDREGEKGLNAAKRCKAERAAMGAQAFAERYGTNANKRNAFGKCVSQYAKDKPATS